MEICRFYNRFGFPGVVGCIDCTHVAIVAPNTNNADHPEHIYVNRKGYHSVNTQIVSNLAFSGIYQFIFMHSLLLLNIERHFFPLK